MFQCIGKSAELLVGAQFERRPIYDCNCMELVDESILIISYVEE